MGLKSRPWISALGNKSPTVSSVSCPKALSRVVVSQREIQIFLLTLNRPDTCSRAEIDNLLWIIPDRRKVKPPVRGFQHHRMQHVLAVLLCLVVGDRVPSVPELMVTPAMLEAMLIDAGVQ